MDSTLSGPLSFGFIIYALVNIIQKPRAYIPLYTFSRLAPSEGFFAENGPKGTMLIMNEIIHIAYLPYYIIRSSLKAFKSIYTTILVIPE